MRAGDSRSKVSRPGWSACPVGSSLNGSHPNTGLVLPPEVTARLAVERPFLWDGNATLASRRRGRPQPFWRVGSYQLLFEQFGFSGENVALRALAVLDKTRR
jgi:hypothetical protein